MTSSITHRALEGTVDRLNEYLALTDQEARDAYLAGLTDEELAELQAAADEAFAAAEEAAPSDENIAELTALADVIEAVAAQTVAREAAEEARAAQRAEVIARVRGQEGDGDEDEPELDEDGNPVTPVVTPPAEGETPPEAEQTPEQIAAAALAAAAGEATPPARPPITSVRARRPPAPRRAESNRAALVAAADVPGIAAGATLVEGGSNDLSGLAAAVVSKYNSLAGSKGVHSVLVASARGSYPEDRQLDQNVGQNMERIQRVMSAMEHGTPEAIVAAGGFCSPATVRYDLPVLGEADRPVRDSLPSFEAVRGRVRWMPSPQLADVAGAVSQWTEAMDIAALTDPAVIKPCLRIDCPDELDAQIYAVPRCLEFGNFNARTYPEQVNAVTTLVGTYHARFAEQLLLAGIDAGSTAVNTGQILGAASDTLSSLDRLLIGIQSRYRIRDPRLRMIAPLFLRNMIRTDISREIPGGGTIDERMAIADARIDEWMRVRNTNVTWTLDEAVFPGQGVGPVIGYPSTVKVRVFLEGTWSFLDGGTLDLGIVRDTTTNATNDFQMFAETFEGVVKFGPGQSFTLTMDLCPDGSVSGTVDIDPCSTGS